MTYGVRCAIGASHWRIDIPERKEGDQKILLVILLMISLRPFCATNKFHQPRKGLGKIVLKVSISTGRDTRRRTSVR